MGAPEVVESTVTAANWYVFVAGISTKGAVDASDVDASDAEAVAIALLSPLVAPVDVVGWLCETSKDVPPDDWARLSSFSITGGATNDGVDCAYELLVIETAVVCVAGVDAVFSVVDEELSSEVAVEKPWSSADGVE